MWLSSRGAFLSRQAAHRQGVGQEFRYKREIKRDFRQFTKFKSETTLQFFSSFFSLNSPWWAVLFGHMVPGEPFRSKRVKNSEALARLQPSTDPH